jgi:hypothetical protein
LSIDAIRLILYQREIIRDNGECDSRIYSSATAATTTEPRIDAESGKAGFIRGYIRI